MALVNIFQLIDKQSFGNEEILNTYFFEAAVGMTAVDVRNAFLEDLMPAIRGIQTDSIVHREIDTMSLGNLGDFDVQSISLSGSGTGLETLPVFNAIGFTLKPATRAVRPGSKRIAGVPENCQNNGEVTQPAYQASMETLRLALDTPISDDDTLFATPIVLKRVKYTVPGSSPARDAYRLPETDAELVFGLLRAVLTSNHITHQVSRGNS